MLAPAPTTGITAVPTTDRRVDQVTSPAAPQPTAPASATAVTPPPEPENSARLPDRFPPTDTRATPAEPADLIATLESPRPTDVEPMSTEDTGPFGPPPAFEQSPLQAQRANFPDPPPEQPTSAYSALQRLETPFDTATVNIAR